MQLSSLMDIWVFLGSSCFYLPEFFKGGMFPQGMIQQVLHHRIVFLTHVAFTRRHPEEFRFAFACRKRKSEIEITFGCTVCHLH